MDIDDIEIKIKKYDREKEVVILNLTFFNKLEERGWRAMLLETKTEPRHSFWKVNPPCIRGKNNTFFWIVRILDKDLWRKLEEKIIEVVKNYPEDV
ncbi:hypothetical protein COY87_05435 [Candidatus Roizmanbacteria bacterium CG_4_10_14_0_8_um_filter_33_9]|uniref:Uncharacterized protein n=1 Tax=Candidatus Roizmanbacteria bacterium CG_4_10_14_0_8_um_filter_33_9 TaxID=1974826 RepID=A0A2M7QHT2_9BACT|nr:MAG: hypothetical protein COY87_05435 [Candidatus Roizmanbacteria bacterium CG_4_10_14_0_8_um_filter_33_9]